MKSLIKSPNDKREYKLISLPNKMRCLLISDPEADKAAAAVDVHIGAANDPRPLYGVAHFLEHMLFQGTEKYPSENEYSEYMKDHGGYNNAFTSSDDTNFHFECSNEGFEGGLDRLAQFFISPKFSENSTEKEVNAVDSEFNMALQNDGWHFWNLLLQMSNKESSMCKFMCGNLKSLDVPGVREALLKFHKTWYSANIMNIAVLAKHSLEQLETWVTEKFSPVVNSNVVVPDLSSPAPYHKDNMGKLISWVPIQDEDELVFVFKVPYTQKEHSSKPSSYVCSLIGHEGENSLFSYLKEEELAIELYTDNTNHWGDCLELFCINVRLSKKGLEN